MTKDEALRIALEAFGTVREWEVADYAPLENAIAALNQALEEPEPEPEQEQEPVAWVNAENLQGLTLGYFGCAEIYTDETQGRIRLYTAPPSKPWVSLTDEELRNAYCEVSGNEWCIGGISNAETFYDAIEAKLKEKNT